MARKKKGEIKLIMPKHSAQVPHFLLPLKICLAHPGGIEIDAFKDELFDELHAAGLEKVKNTDGSHYTKCLQLPRYFGLVRYCLSGERGNAITARGRAMYDALTSSPVDYPAVHQLLFDAITNLNFGRLNEGVGSESYCEPFAIFFRAAKDLNGITNSEFGYLIQEMDENGRPYKQILNEIINSRSIGKKLNIISQSQADNIADWKAVLLLQNLHFLTRDSASGRMCLQKSLEPLYGYRLAELPLYSHGYKKQLFICWLKNQGLGQSVENYPESLEAMSSDIGEKDSAKFYGFFKTLTGKLPRCNVFNVKSLDDYDRTFDKLNQFWNMPDSSAPGGFEEDRFYECFFYAKAPKKIDNNRLLCACDQYRKFLAWWDSNRQDFDIQDIDESQNIEEEKMYTGVYGSLQRIVYGAPGTGKSHWVNEEIKKHCPEKDVVRTTFHPDSDYSTFVGAYKPTMEKFVRTVCVGTKVEEAKDKDGNTVEDKRIVYKFVMQAFVKAYIRAWENMVSVGEGQDPKPQFLVIEEINRGNCAQIFGDLFQLLDRDDNGYSEYPVVADSDLCQFIADEFKKDGIEVPEPTPGNEDEELFADILKGVKVVLPPNLYIWATMNTSDQSLFPIDSAFKRRWDWKYEPIKDEGKGWKITVGGRKYDWWNFLKTINDKIGRETGSEDKKLGYYFVKAESNGEINAEKFVNKVAFYLWSDVFNITGTDGEQFRYEDDNGKKQELKFHSFFKEADGTIDEKVVCQFLDNFEISFEEVSAATPAAEATSAAPDTPAADSDASGEDDGEGDQDEA